MAKLSVSEAAKAFQVSRPTLQKALKDGTISGDRTVKNGVETWQIEASELARVYELRAGKLAAEIDRSDADLSANKAPISNQLPDEAKVEIEALKARLAEAELKLQAAEKQVIDERLAAADAKARAEERQGQLERLDRLMAMLPKPDQHQDRLPWWSMFNRRK